MKGNVNESLYCAAKWGVRGYTESLKATMDTDFWNENRDYVPTEKSSKWMKAKDVAKVIFENITNDNLCVSEIVIERV